MSPLVERLVLVALALAAIHLPLVPVGHAADRLPVPDLLFCLVLAWTLRHPAVASLPLVLALGLVADLLIARPPGVGALGLVLATEAVRGQRMPTPPREWLTAGILFGAVLAGTTALLALSLAPLPGRGALAGHWVATLIAYPVVAALVHLLLRPRARPELR